MLREWQPGQYLYVDGRQKTIAETVKEIDEALKAPLLTLPPFQLDALNERELEQRLADLFTHSFTYSMPTFGATLKDDRRKIKRRVDLILIRVDELLGKQDIIVEVKANHRRHSLGFEVVPQVEEYLRLAQAHEAWIVTTGNFKEEVHRYVDEHPRLVLIDRERLVKMLRDKGVKVISNSL